MRKAIDEYEIRQTGAQSTSVQDDTTVTVVKDVDYEKVEEQ